MKNYKYKTMSEIYALKEEELNDEQNDGWEFVSHCFANGRYNYVFRKLK